MDSNRRPPPYLRSFRQTAAEVAGSTRLRAEPALSPRRCERGLVRGELAGWPHESRGRGRAAEELGLDHADHPAAQFDVARARAFVRAVEDVPAQASSDVVGDHASRGL